MTGQPAGTPSPTPANTPFRGFRAMLSFYSRLPLGLHIAPDFSRHVWAVPLVGALIGAIGAVTGLAAYLAGLSTMLAAILTIAVQVIITGAFHEDGLADSADGLWGGMTRERRLEIMRDSRVGTFGAAALVLSLMLRVAALAELFRLSGPYALLVLPGIGAMSRCIALLPVLRLPPARTDGLAHEIPMPRDAQLGLALILAAALIAPAGFALDLLAGLALALVFALSGLWLAIRLAKAKIGGHTGDILGATQQVCEIILLVTLSAAANWRGPV